ncbi:hypothetical protein O3P69_004456 [Scylla paramamosain]|uniref:Uncharacterized protein n=1 Tax=Scylla paramamosain TaxID=85552 RepID=A0AAW0UDZ1_SCYPA
MHALQQVIPAPEEEIQGTEEEIVNEEAPRVIEEAALALEESDCTLEESLTFLGPSEVSRGQGKAKDRGGSTARLSPQIAMNWCIPAVFSVTRVKKAGEQVTSCEERRSEIT